MAEHEFCYQAPAKINLYLKITGRRSDGYHELETLMQKIALFDRLNFTLLPQSGIRLDCGECGLPEDKNNIIFRAASLFFDFTATQQQGVRIVLEKNIPIAAGLGGGSSDAAAVLLALDRLCATHCSRKELADLGLQLGADVPFFVYEMSTGWATGIGEELSPATPLTDFLVVLANPGISVSTKWAYETFALTSAENIFNLYCSQKENHGNMSGVNGRDCPFTPKELKNDLEDVTSGKFCVIKKIKQKMLDEGALGALMSGSGPTVFGLFSKACRQEAETCCQELQKEFDQVYLVAPLA